jgi:integrase
MLLFCKPGRFPLLAGRLPVPARLPQHQDELDIVLDDGIGLVGLPQERAVYVQPTDFVFAGDSGKPRWQETILADHIKPAAKAANIQGKVGWHTLRHSYSTLLRAHGTDVKVQQELLRHANVSTTLNTYTQAVSAQKREAASKVVKELLGGTNTEGTVSGPQVVPTGTF